MKRLILLFTLLPILSFCQVNVTVTEKQTPAQVLNESRQASAEAAKAKAAKSAAMVDANIEISIPIEVDLNNYSHIALVSVKMGSYMSKYHYRDIQSSLADSPFQIVNPYLVNKERAKKDSRFLRNTKDEKWLYLYYDMSTVGVNEIRRVIVKDYQNKIIFHSSTTNTPLSKTIEPLVFF